MSESRSRPSTTATSVSKRTDSTLERAIGGSTLPGKGELLYTGTIYDHYSSDIDSFWSVVLNFKCFIKQSVFTTLKLFVS